MESVTKLLKKWTDNLPAHDNDHSSCLLLLRGVPLDGDGRELVDVATADMILLLGLSRLVPKLQVFVQCFVQGHDARIFTAPAYPFVVELGTTVSRLTTQCRCLDMVTSDEVALAAFRETQARPRSWRALSLEWREVPGAETLHPLEVTGVKEAAALVQKTVRPQASALKSNDAQFLELYEGDPWALGCAAAQAESAGETPGEAPMDDGSAGFTLQKLAL